MTQSALAGFRLPPEVEAFRTRVVKFCDTHVRPRAEAIEVDADYPADLHRRFAEAGLLRAIVPDDCRGLGLGFLGRTVLIEKVARVSAAVSMIPQVNELGCTPLAIVGTPEQRQALGGAGGTGRAVCVVWTDGARGRVGRGGDAQLGGA